jgi:hypothetical protein
MSDDERPMQEDDMVPTDPERPAAARPAEQDALQDQRALTVLTTEHYSLLAARGLVYNESFMRGGMFLTFLSATLVALGLVATATGFSDGFLAITAGVLGVDLFIGLATIGRVMAATREDFRYLQGMNRLRHAYHEAVPGLERYFVAGRHDDLRGLFAAYGSPDGPMSRTRSSILHGCTTMPGMLAVISSCVSGVLAGVLLLLLTDSDLVAGLGCVAVLLVGSALSLDAIRRSMAAIGRTLDVAFPSAE